MSFQSNYTKYLRSTTQGANEDMTEKEMQELQEAIERSKSDSISQKEQDTDASEIQEKFSKASISGLEARKLERRPSKLSDKAKSQKKSDFKITFQDLLESNYKPLDVVQHNPVFDLGIPTNPAFQKYSVKERAQLLADQFTKTAKVMMELARRSPYMAPLPKPILPSDKCNVSLVKSDEANEADDFVSTDADPVSDLYVSRAGRHVKRKVYTEAAEIDSDSDFAYGVKKNKNEHSDMKITMDTPFTAEEIHVHSTPTSKIPQKSKLSLKKPTTRSEELFDAMVQNEEKTQRKLEDCDNFVKSLSTLDDNEFVLDSPVKSESDEQVRRRISPPILMKGGARPKKLQKPEGPEKKDGSVSPTIKRQTNLPRKAQPKPRSRHSKLDKEETVCPICDKKFPKSQITNHAADCGIEDTLPATAGTNRIKCELCEEYISETMYTTHVKQCIASKVTDL